MDSVKDKGGRPKIWTSEVVSVKVPKRSKALIKTVALTVQNYPGAEAELSQFLENLKRRMESEY